MTTKTTNKAQATTQAETRTESTLDPWTIALLLVAAVLLVLGVLSFTSASTVEAETSHAETAGTVEPVAGTDLSKVTLTEHAVKRTGVETATVTTVKVNGKDHLSIPYDAVLYDAEGAAWTYTNPDPRVYLRAPLTIVSIDKGQAILSTGPAAGTKVVTVGAAELYGTEFGVGH